MASHAEMLEAKIFNLKSQKDAVLPNEDRKAMLRRQSDEMNDQFTDGQTSLENRQRTKTEKQTRNKTKEK